MKSPGPDDCKVQGGSKKFATFLTSCGRFDLLGETVASFHRYFDVDRIVISEDSENTAAAAQFMRDFPVAEVHVNLPKLGQMRSIDAHYATLDAPYVFCTWRTTGVSRAASTSIA